MCGDGWECAGRLSVGCSQADWIVWGGCLAAVDRLTRGCGDIVWRVWIGCQECV